MKKIVVVVGARPQFIKHAPVELALRTHFETVSIHTGQHYDQKMSEIFFDQLKIPAPQYRLNVGSHIHGKQTATMLEQIEEILLIEKPDGLLVYGDTNSTLAGALAASKLNIPIIHIEAGLRSFNRAMPEEINRVLTDHISSIHFSPTSTATENLLKEGITESVYNVGDVMYDSLLLALEIIKDEPNKNDEYVLCTIHRPYNTDDITRLVEILTSLNSISYKVIFPIHPRTLRILAKNKIATDTFANVDFVDPVSYFDLIRLQKFAHCIITDSGGIQKEAYMLRKKCITLRTETEWVETLEHGWNTLVFADLQSISSVIHENPGKYIDDLYGDGDASLKIAEVLSKELSK